MPELHATWMSDNHLFFWASDNDILTVSEYELPDLKYADGHVEFFSLAISGERMKRRRTRGVQVKVTDALPVLATVGDNEHVTDSIRCWSGAAKFALRLAAAQRVVPTIDGNQARWKALLSAKEDRDVFNHLVRAFPTVSRCLPSAPRGNIRLHSSSTVLRRFLDRAVDTLYRQQEHPGSAKGWALEYANALRGDDPHFLPREARHQGVVERLSRWSSSNDVAALIVGFQLELPQSDTDAFPMTLWIHPADAPAQRMPMEQAWKAGNSVVFDNRPYLHPAHFCIRGLARASRLFKPIRRCLRGKSPSPLDLDANQTYDFLTRGKEELEQAGFEVTVPEAFALAGQQRIRARMCFGAHHQDGEIDLTGVLHFRWELALGDQLIQGDEFAELVSRNQPIVKFNEEWIFLDPSELAKLPEEMEGVDRLPSSAALHAILTGHYNSIPVVADDRLSVLIDALKSPTPLEQPANLNATLRPYQVKGFSWLSTLGQLGLGACLADDMGLGKTIQVIAYFLQRQTYRTGPKLVVCPTSVLGNWSREIRKFAPELTQLRYHGANRDSTQFESVDVVLTTYGLLVRDWDELADIHWDVLVLDEAQAIKNPDSQRARAARTLNASHRIGLSGTPVENHLDELWSILEFLIPGLLGTRTGFRTRFALPIERFGDHQAAMQLKKGIASFMLRRVKTDKSIITDLPEKIERHEYTPLTREQGALYEEVMEEGFGKIQQSNDIERRGHVLAMLTRLKQVCNHPDHYLNGDGPLSKRSGKLNRVEKILDQIMARGESTLIFTQYRAMGSRLQAHLRRRYQTRVPFLHGGSSIKQREEMVADFQKEKGGEPILIISLKAGGTGLNLTRATHVIHYDRWWNPAVEDQATDRAYRIGQHCNVSVYKLVSQGTLEERIDQLLEQKRELAEQIVGSSERWVTELDDNALRNLVSLGEDAVTTDT
jgi:SNF2 family DNA or RNA helicase